MARQVRRISDLPEAGPLTGDELLEIVQGGDNKRASVDQLSGSAPVQSVQGRTGDVVITADDVGLGSVDNTSDAEKPISTAQQAALDGKVDAVAGKQLSTEDYTTGEKSKLGDLPTAAQLSQSLADKADSASLGTAALADVEDFDPAGAAAAAQAFAIQRANHTGTQAISTVAGLQGELDAINLLIGDTSAALDAINGEVI